MKIMGVALLVLLLGGCSTSGSDGEDGSAKADSLPAVADAGSLFGSGTWKLRDMSLYAGPIPTETREPLTLQLVSADSGLELRGNGGCNGFSMAVVVNGVALKPGPIRASKMACEHLGFEKAYFDTLGKVESVRQQGEELQLMMGGDAVLRYGRLP